MKDLTLNLLLALEWRIDTYVIFSFQSSLLLKVQKMNASLLKGKFFKRLCFYATLCLISLHFPNDQIHDRKIESIVSEWVLRTALPSCKSIYRNVTRGMASSRCTIAHQNPRRDQRPIPSSMLSSNHSCIFANL